MYNGDCQLVRDVREFKYTGRTEPPPRGVGVENTDILLIKTQKQKHQQSINQTVSVSYCDPSGVVNMQ